MPFERCIGCVSAPDVADPPGWAGAEPSGPSALPPVSITPCRVCRQRFSATTPWAFPSTPVWSRGPPMEAVLDSIGRPLTWQAVCHAHRWLTWASTEGYDSDVGVDPATSATASYLRHMCAAWPGPICGACFAGCCVSCDRAIASWGAAGAVAPCGRLLCRLCAPPSASLFDVLCSTDAALLAVECPVAVVSSSYEAALGHAMDSDGDVGAEGDLPDPLAPVLGALEVVQGYVDYESRSSQWHMARANDALRRFRAAAAALADSGLAADDRARLSQAGRDLDVARRGDVARAFGVLDW